MQDYKTMNSNDNAFFYLLKRIVYRMFLFLKHWYINSLFFTFRIYLNSRLIIEKYTNVFNYFYIFRDILKNKKITYLNLIFVIKNSPLFIIGLFSNLLLIILIILVYLIWALIPIYLLLLPLLELLSI